jgi:hypothetical protein
MARLSKQRAHDDKQRLGGMTGTIYCAVDGPVDASEGLQDMTAQSVSTRAGLACHPPPAHVPIELGDTPLAWAGGPRATTVQTLTHPWTLSALPANKTPLSPRTDPAHPWTRRAQGVAAVPQPEHARIPVRHEHGQPEREHSNVPTNPGSPTTTDGPVPGPRPTQAQRTETNTDTQMQDTPTDQPGAPPPTG